MVKLGDLLKLGDLVKLGDLFKLVRRLANLVPPRRVRIVSLG